MFGFEAADATSILSQITTNGSGIVSTLVSLAGVLLAVAAFRWVFKLIRGALHF